MKKIDKNNFNNKTILITGGTGSFGKNFLKRILNFDCEIRVFSRDELKQNELRNEINNPKPIITFVPAMAKAIIDLLYSNFIKRLNLNEINKGI